MAIAYTVTETFRSRELGAGVHMIYDVHSNHVGSEGLTEQEARYVAWNAAPATFPMFGDTVKLCARWNSIRVIRKGHNWWRVTITYLPPYDITFDTTGGKTTKYVADHVLDVFKEPVPFVSYDAVNPLHDDGPYDKVPLGELNSKQYYVINPGDDEVKGIEVPLGNFLWTETWWWGAITTTYMKRLAELTGTVNEQLFRGFLRGEVMFLGVQGGRNSSGLFGLSYKFSMKPSENPYSLLGGRIYRSIMEGWWHLSEKYDYRELDPDKSGPRVDLIRVPTEIRIQQIYPYGNFNDMLLGNEDLGGITTQNDSVPKDVGDTLGEPDPVVPS